MGGLERGLAFLVNSAPPCLLFEDDHLLVANKPAGLNTHSPSPHAGEGLYDWLRHREPRWSSLAIIHRLDKETSGVIVFAKSVQANQSLTRQFTERKIRKRYLLLTDHPVPDREFSVRSVIVRQGDRYISRSSTVDADPAETTFRFLGKLERFNLMEARPETGRTHQIRVHAADQGFPILGDLLYGGSPAERVFLHAEEIILAHPVSGETLRFEALHDFPAGSRLALRNAIIDPDDTNAYRLIHGESDRWPGQYLERYGDYLLSQSERPLDANALERVQFFAKSTAARGIYHKTWSRHVRQTKAEQSSPQPVSGEEAPGVFEIVENGIKFEISFREGYSVGIFLDQRDNRRRLLTGHVAADFPLYQPPATQSEVLNTFAYTCGFSVCAARAGARVTSLDVSNKYLTWGKRNFQLNGLDPAVHDFIYGDTFDWMRRFAKRGREFDVIVLDPPTFSQSRESGVFQAEKHYGKLVAAALPVLKRGGLLLCSTNAARLEPERFLAMISQSIEGARRQLRQQKYFPQPIDFPISREEPAYLKTVWLRID